MSGARRKNRRAAANPSTSLRTRLWDRGAALDREAERFTVGEDYLLDRKLVKYDCLASIAHARALGKAGLLRTKEVQRLVQELNRIIALDKRGKFKISRAEEDCHTAIENHLTKRLGDAGKKIHVARSRNDQVLTALRLYCKEELGSCRGLAHALVQSIRGFVKKYGKVKLPGYTHMRKAMPSSVAMWGGAFVDSMKDNLKLADAALELIDQSPLGTGAGYGVPLRIDRQRTAKLLGFKRVQKNPVYAQMSRGKFEATLLHALSQIMFDLNKISSDLILFSMPELGYFEIPEEFCTGSSMMPQKKNPDVLELLRAKYHAVVSCEFYVKSVTANLLSGYNRDVQLTKGPTMQGLEIVKESLSVAARIFKKLRVNKENCKKALTEEIYATEKAYKLVRKGKPFREAYGEVARRY
jgi:argininosuccinate lyase